MKKGLLTEMLCGATARGAVSQAKDSPEKRLLELCAAT
jgi:hypothetical protein